MKQFGGYAEEVLKGIWSKIECIEITAIVTDGKGCYIDLTLSKEYPSTNWTVEFYCVNARMKAGANLESQFWSIGHFEKKSEAIAYADDTAWRAGVKVVDLCDMTMEQRAENQELASRFSHEVLDSINTLGELACADGVVTLSDVFYLQMAIIDGGFIDYLPSSGSNIMRLVELLPSKKLWMNYIHVHEEAAAA